MAPSAPELSELISNLSVVALSQAVAHLWQGPTGWPLSRYQKLHPPAIARASQERTWPVAAMPTEPLSRCLCRNT
jgi:hypothetical protein